MQNKFKTWYWWQIVCNAKIHKASSWQTVSYWTLYDNCFSLSGLASDRLYFGEQHRSEPNLLSDIDVPSDACANLALNSQGSLFDTGNMQVCTWINVQTTHLSELMKWCLVPKKAGIYVTSKHKQNGPVIRLNYLCINGYVYMCFSCTCQSIRCYYKHSVNMLNILKYIEVSFICIFIHLFCAKMLYSRKPQSSQDILNI